MATDAMAHFHEVACGTLGAEQCYPVVQPGEKDAQQQDTIKLPSIVYYAIGQDTVALLAGPYQIGTAIRYEARAHSYAETVTLSAAVITALRQAGRLSQMLSLFDDYDDDLNIFRRIRSVMMVA